MRFLHTSDWHLGAMAGEISLKEDQRFFIDQICQIVKDNKVDAVIIAGDIFDRSVSSGEAIKLYSEAMSRLCLEMKIPTLIIAGNHDSAERLASCNELLSFAGLHILGEITHEAKVVSFDDADVYFLPWITEEKVKSVFTDKKEQIGSLEDAYSVVTESMKKTFDPKKKHILISHSFITDSETSTSDRSAEIGYATQVASSVFDGFDYVALGHLHKPQNVTESIRYSGTPMPYSFGKEEEHEKSVTIIDTSDMSKKIVPLKLLHKRITIEGALNYIMDPEVVETNRDSFVRLNVTDSYVGQAVLSELKVCYPNLLEVSGKSFEADNSSITLSMDEFEELESDPIEIFKYFCEEEIGEAPTDHEIELFKNAVEEAEKEENK